MTIENAIATLRDRFGDQLSTARVIREHHGHDESWHPDALPDAVIFPETTEQVSEIVKICAETRTPIVTQSGNTGLTGGGQPHMGGAEIVLSLDRMTRIREVDPLNDSMTVEAGVILKTVQEEAAKVDRLFPLSLAAEGSCRIGGNLSTNAGGVQVLRYGNARALATSSEPDAISSWLEKTCHGDLLQHFSDIVREKIKDVTYYWKKL